MVTNGGTWTSPAPLSHALHTAGASSQFWEGWRGWGLHTWGLLSGDNRGGNDGGRRGLLAFL